MLAAGGGVARARDARSSGKTPSSDLFGFTGLQRVEAVYIPNRFETGIVWSGIVAREKNVHLWHFELTEPIVVPVLPAPKFAQPSAASLVRLRHKVADDKEKKKDGEAK
jgi:hypothetical protein